VPHRPLQLVIDQDVERPARSVVIFFPDGLDRTRMEELLAAGELPHIRERFVEGGVRVEHAIASLPPITYPNCSSVITGRFPGHHDILGNAWFDRRSLTAQDYASFETYRTVDQDMTSPTLYDLLADDFTCNIQNNIRRGVTQSIDNAATFAWLWISGQYIAADRYASYSLEEAVAIANRVKRWPTVLMTYYPGVDEVGHRWGPDSPEYASALRNFDAIVGRVTEALDGAGASGATYFVLLTDHGMAPVGAETQLDLRAWLRDERGVRLRTTPVQQPSYVDRLALMDGYDAAATVNAGRLAIIHLRGERGWPHRPEPDEVLAWLDTPPSVRELPAVGLIAIRAGEDGIQVLSREGLAMVERRKDGTSLQYRIARYEGDPLGYRADPSAAAWLDGSWHASRDWLEASADTRCPDFVPQVVEMFDSPRTGDVVLFAAPGWSLYRGERGGHGSCLARDMRNVLCFAGPDLPAGTTIPRARLVDVMPTLLGLLGRADRLDAAGAIDGIDLSDQLRAITDP
jgi:arylsulfatase A-like enzyme